MQHGFCGLAPKGKREKEPSGSTAAMASKIERAFDIIADIHFRGNVMNDVRSASQFRVPNFTAAVEQHAMPQQDFAFLGEKNVAVVFAAQSINMILIRLNRLRGRRS